MGRTVAAEISGDRMVTAPRVLAVVGLTGFWLLLVDSTDLAEVAAGFAVAALATAIGVRAFADDPVAWTGRRTNLRAMLAIPPAIARDVTLVLIATLLHILRVRPVRGAFHMEPASEARARGGAGRRAALTMRVSWPPNTFVLGFDREREGVVVHRLVPPR